MSAYSDACFIPGEKADHLEDGVIRLMAKFRPPCGPPVIVRTDEGTGFQSIKSTKSLCKQNITLEIGASKNINKNPSSEKAISEFHAEVARLQPGGGPLDEVSLALAVSNLNSRIRHGGLSASELWCQRDMHTGAQLPIKDIEFIRAKAASRIKGHLPSAKYKARGSVHNNATPTAPGDIVYLYQDRDKTRSRDKYIVIHADNQRSQVQKFVGSQLRSKIYEVNNADIIKIKPYIFPKVDDTADFTDRDHIVTMSTQSYDEENDDSSVTDAEDVDDMSEDDERDASEDTAENDGGDIATESEEEEDLNQVESDHAEDIPTIDDQSARPTRTRKPPARYKAYYTGKRLSQVVPRE